MYLVLLSISNSFNIDYFAGHELQRRLEFTSHYDVRCSLLDDQIVNSTLKSVAISNINKLKPVCGKGSVIN